MMNNLEKQLKEISAEFKKLEDSNYMKLMAESFRILALEMGTTSEKLKEELRKLAIE